MNDLFEQELAAVESISNVAICYAARRLFSRRKAC